MPDREMDFRREQRVRELEEMYRQNGYGAYNGDMEMQYTEADLRRDIAELYPSYEDLERRFG